MGKLVDLTNQKFGKLTVIKRAPNDKNGNVQWLCNCDCGNEKVVRGNDLISNKQVTCGWCNTYNLSGDYGICTMSNNKQFIFDLEDYNLIRQYCWRTTPNGYIQSGNQIKLHRLITNCPDGFVVDHISNDKTDNRKSNLRVCKQNENCMNHSLNSNNTSGVTGVNWHKASNKWIVRIKVNYKTIYIGTFDKFDDAVKARKEAEEKYFGEYSYDNSRNT
jgi:hypothetical protein